MPTTLEDTAIDFPVTTLNDLLEAEAKAGVTVGADEEKYRRWAFISTGAAGLLAIMLAVVLITGGGDSGGGDESKPQTAEKPAGWPELSFNVSSEGKIGGAKPGDYVKVSSTETGAVLVKAGIVTYLGKVEVRGVESIEFRLAFPPEEEAALTTADRSSLLYQKLDSPPPSQPAEATTTTAPAAPAAETPSAPTPEAPVPETSPATQPAG
jgi:hypothetical protein